MIRFVLLFKHPSLMVLFVLLSSLGIYEGKEASGAGLDNNDFEGGILVPQQDDVELTINGHGDHNKNKVKVECRSSPGHDNLRGPPGRDGLPGIGGNPGVPGVPGIPGKDGQPGSCKCNEDLKSTIRSGELFIPNIHQCAWNKLSYALEAGKVQTCTFKKRLFHTALKVEWYGSIRVVCSRDSPCCNRWYITFNGAECSNPMTIDGLVFIQDHNATINIHRSTTIAGICNEIPEGIINVALWTGECDGSYPTGPSRTGWNSASRLIIQEIPLK